MEKNKILMVVIIALLVILLSAMGFLGFTLVRFMQNSGKNANNDIGSMATLPIGDVTLVPLTKPISTNLKAGVDGLSHIISVSLSVGVNNTDKKESPLLVQQLTSQESIVRDICLSTIRNKTFEELQSQDSETALSNEILARLQDTFKNNLIYQVYISDFYIE